VLVPSKCNVGPSTATGLNRYDQILPSRIAQANESVEADPYKSGKWKTCRDGLPLGDPRSVPNASTLRT